MDRLPNSVVAAVAIFPRRPKLMYGGDSDLFVKFNSEVFRFAFHSEREQIPVLAAVPITSTLQELATDPKILWFEIGGAITGAQFVRVERTDATLKITQSDAPNVSEARDLASVIAFLSKAARPRSWDSLIGVLDNIRHATYFREFNVFNRLYRPYVVLYS